MDPRNCLTEWSGFQPSLLKLKRRLDVRFPKSYYTDILSRLPYEENLQTTSGSISLLTT